MNGRVYDPEIALFLSPDNYVQNATNSQNFNRYTYCLNNPLMYTDPSGDIILPIICALGNAYFNGVMANNKEFNPLDWDWGNSNTYISIGTGIVSGYGMGKSIESFFQNRKFRNKVNDRAIAIRDFPSSPTGALEKSNYTLDLFSEKVFSDYDYSDKGRRIWDLDKTQVPEDASAITKIGAGYVDGKVDIYFSDNSFSSKWTLFNDMGHEYVHLANYVEL